MAGATRNCCQLGAFCVHHTTMHRVTSCKATYVKKKKEKKKKGKKEKRFRMMIILIIILIMMMMMMMMMIKGIRTAHDLP